MLIAHEFACNRQCRYNIRGCWLIPIFSPGHMHAQLCVRLNLDIACLFIIDYTVLYGTVLYCTVLYYNIMILSDIVLYCLVLSDIVWYGLVLSDMILWYDEMMKWYYDIRLYDMWFLIWTWNDITEYMYIQHNTIHYSIIS